MPATSKSQQRYMAMVAQGIIDPPEGLTRAEARKFAKTKHKGLPERVGEAMTFKEYFMYEGDVLPFKHPSTDALDLIMDHTPGEVKKDAKIMKLIHFYVNDPNNPMVNRVQALAKLDTLMGVDNGKVTPEDVKEYIESGGQSTRKDK